MRHSQVTSKKAAGAALRQTPGFEDLKLSRCKDTQFCSGNESYYITGRVRGISEAALDLGLNTLAEQFKHIKFVVPAVVIEKKDQEFVLVKDD